MSVPSESAQAVTGQEESALRTGAKQISLPEGLNLLSNLAGAYSEMGPGLKPLPLHG